MTRGGRLVIAWRQLNRTPAGAAQSPATQSDAPLSGRPSMRSDPNISRSPLRHQALPVHLTRLSAPVASVPPDDRCGRHPGLG